MKSALTFAAVALLTASVFAWSQNTPAPDDPGTTFTISRETFPGKVHFGVFKIGTDGVHTPIGIAFEREVGTLDIDKMVGEEVCFTLTAKDKNGNVIRSWNTSGVPTTLTLVGSTANTDSSNQSWNDDPEAYTWALITKEGGGVLTQMGPDEWSVPAGDFNDEGQCRICLVHTKAEKGITIRVTPLTQGLNQETDKMNFRELGNSNFLVEVYSQVAGKDAVFQMRPYEITVYPRDRYLNVTNETIQTRFTARWPGEFDNTSPGLADIFSGDMFITGPTPYLLASRIIRELPNDEPQWIMAYAENDPSIRGRTNDYEILSHAPHDFTLLTPPDHTVWTLDRWTQPTLEDFTWEKPVPADPYTDIKISRNDLRTYSDEVRYTVVFVDSISLTRAVRIASDNLGIEPTLKLTQGQLQNIVTGISGSPTTAYYHLVWFVEATDGLYVTQSTPPNKDPNGEPGFHLTLDISTSAPTTAAPSKLALAQNYPNPFNPSTSINFSLPAGGKASVKIYDLLGAYVATAADGDFSAGEHRVNFNAADLPSGIYIYKLHANGKTLTRRMTLMR